MNSFEDILRQIKGKPKKTIAVAMAEDAESLMAIAHAHKEGLADAVLVGNKSRITEISAKIGVDLVAFDIIHADGEQQSVVRAIQIVREHLADTLMKGNCSTATLLRGVLDKDHGLREGKILSHFAAFELQTYHKLLYMSDAAMNIAPDLETKIAITENAIQAARKIGVATPKVAIIAAVEKVNYASMPCTTDAAIMSKMAQRGQIANAILDGPLALDNAVSKKSCEVKMLDSPVGGDTDILIMPDLEAANIFYKTLTYLGGSKSAGIITGAKVPVILPSRADSEETKFLSLALGMITSVRERA
jgi:phosphate butyryltransferase